MMIENVEELSLSKSLDSLPNEEWKVIPRYENRYYVSNYSRVLDTYKKERILNKYDFGNRMVIRLRNRRGKYHYYTDVKLSAEAFLNNENNNSIAKFIDGNYKNGKIDNVKLLSRCDLYRSLFGEKNPNAKLTKNQVVEIRRLKRDGISAKTISNTFNVSLSAIFYVLNKGWKQVNEEVV